MKEFSWLNVPLPKKAVAPGLPGTAKWMKPIRHHPPRLWCPEPQKKGKQTSDSWWSGSLLGMGTCEFSVEFCHHDVLVQKFIHPWNPCNMGFTTKPKWYQSKVPNLSLKFYITFRNSEENLKISKVDDMVFYLETKFIWNLLFLKNYGILNVESNWGLHRVVVQGLSPMVRDFSRSEGVVSFWSFCVPNICRIVEKVTP